MADGMASYGPETSTSGWDVTPQAPPDRQVADLGFTPTDIDYYATGYEGYPTLQQWYSREAEPVPESYADFFYSPEHQARIWNAFDSQIANLPYVGKGLQPSERITPEFAAFVNQKRSEGRSDTEIAKDWYFSKMGGTDWRTWTDQDKMVYNYVFGGRDMRIGSLAMDEKGRPLDIHWEMALSHPDQGVGLISTLQKFVDAGYQVDFYGIDRDGNYIFDSRPTVNSLVAKQPDFAGGFQKRASEVDPRFQAYYDYQGNPLLEPQWHRDLTGIWYTTPEGEVGRLSYVVGQGRTSARGISVAQFNDGTYMERLPQGLFNKQAITDEWARSPLGEQRINNFSYFNTPATDEEYLQVRGVSPAQARQREDTIRNVLTGVNDTVDLLSTGLITQEEWNKIAPQELKGMTPEQVIKISEAANAAYNDASQELAEYKQYGAPEENAAMSFLSNVLDRVDALGKMIPDIGVNIGPVEFSIAAQSLLFPPLGNLLTQLGGVVKLMDTANEYAIKPLVATATLPAWIQKSEPEYQEAWSNFMLSPDESHVDLLKFKDIEVAKYIVRNTVEQYEKANPWGVRLAVESLPWLFIPAGAAKTGTQATRAAAVEVARARAAYNDLQNVARNIRTYSTDEMGDIFLNAEARLKSAVSNLEKVGGKDAVNRESLAALKEATQNRQVSETLGKQIDSLKAAGKPVPAEMTAKLAESQKRWDEASNRAIALMSRDAAQSFTDQFVTNPGELARLPGHKALEPVMFNPDKSLEVGQWMRSIPGLKQFVDVAFSNVRSAETALSRAQAMYAAEKSMASALAWSQTIGLRAEKFPLEFALKGVEKNIVKNVVPIKGTRGVVNPHIQEVLQHPVNYKFTDPALKYNSVYEHPTLKGMYELLMGRQKLAEDAGVKFNALKLAEDEVFMPRRGVSLKGQPLPTRERPFHEKLWQKGRDFDEVGDALVRGYEYNNDPIWVTFKTLETTYQAVAEKHYIDVIKQFGTDKLPRLAELDRDAAKKTVSSLASIYQRIEGTEGKLHPSTLKSIASRSKVLAQAIKEGKSKQEIKTLAYEELQKANRVLSERQAQVDELDRLFAIKNVPDLEGMKFTRDIATQVEKVLRPKPTAPGLRGVLGANQVLRFAVTGPDLGAPFIHGLPLLFSNPKLWGQSWGRMVQSMASEGWMAKYAAKNKDSVLTAITRGHMNFDSAEFMEGAALLERIPGVKTVVRPFERAFNGFLDTSRMELWKSLYRPNMTDLQAAKVGRFIDDFMGTLNPAKLNQSANHRAIETIALFAPRYYRSMMALTGEAFKGGLTNNQALKAFASFQAGMHLAYWCAAKTVGQEPVLNPADPNYLNLTVGNTKMGFGGFFRTFNQLIARTVVAAATEPEKVPSIIGRFFQSKMSIVSKLPLEFTLGETYIGQSVVNPMDFAKYSLAPSMLPIWVKAWMEQYPKDRWYDRAFRGLAEFVGLRTTGIRPSQELITLRNQIAQQRHGVDYNTLWSKDPRAARSIDDVPQIRELERQAFVERYSKGAGRFGDKQMWLDWQKADDESRDNWTAELWNAEAKLKASGGTKEAIGAFRETLQKAGASRSEDIAELKTQFPNVYKSLAEVKPLPDDASAAYIAYRDYADIIFGVPDNPNLSLDEIFALQDKAKAEYVGKYGEQMYEEMRAAYLTGRNLPFLYTQYKTDVDDIAMSGYWKLPTTQQDNGLARYTFRRDNPEIDAKLNTWGYVSTIQSDKAAGILRNIFQDYGWNNRVVPVPAYQIQYQKEYDRLTNEKNAAYNRAYQSKQNQSVDYKSVSNAVTSVQNEIRNYQNKLKSGITPDDREKTLTNLKNASLKLEQFYHVTTNMSYIRPNDLWLKGLMLEIELERHKLKQ